MLFTFPSRYWFAIGLSGVFSLTGWSRLIHAEFLVLRATQDTTMLRLRDCHLLRCYFPEASIRQISCNDVVLQPLSCRNMAGLGYSPFARHYLGNHYLFSFPAGTKMFQFPALASIIRMDGIPSEYRVVPFGNPRIKGHLHLPAAYRSLSRPSSPPRAKPCALAYFFVLSTQQSIYTFSFQLLLSFCTSCHRSS